jgi:hypothetical protein
MSSGLLGKSSTNANNYVTIYTVPNTAQFSTVNINCLNIDPNNIANVRIASTLTPSTPGLSDHIEYNAEIPSNGGILERTSFVMSPGESIAVWSDNSNVMIRVYGLEQD